jgi:predicted amidophosphoribosyltransferase
VNKLEFCLVCDRQLSGFEHDICNDCAYAMEEDGEDIEKEIERLKNEQY